MKPGATVIEIFEYKPIRLDANIIDYKTAEIIEEKYGSKIDICYPHLRNKNKWILSSKGYVGFIALGKEISIRLSPKVSVGNLFLMLDYAYEFRGIEFQNDLVQCDSIEDFYDRLAILLANRILETVQKGIYKSYIPKARKFLCIKGRINTKSFAKNPWDMGVECEYQEFTSNIEDNRILAWTLFLIINSGACSRSLPTVRKSLQAVVNLVEIKPCRSEDCINRTYNQLNERYRSLHALCRFFLDSSSASLNFGEYSMLSFFVDMARLFESFVASWLKFHLPDCYRLEKQERYDYGEFKFIIDLVLYDMNTGLVKSVIDTKYKSRVEQRDLEQIYFYAASKNCNEACLVYPATPEKYRSSYPKMKNTTIRTLVFSLDKDLEDAGQKFIKSLLREDIH